MEGRSGSRRSPGAASAARGGGPQPAHGILPSQQLKALIGEDAIAAEAAVTEVQIQPASLDLRLGTEAHRVRASFLPGARATVPEKIDEFGMHRMDLSDGAVLERGCVYIVPLQESLRLPADLSGAANPKSSTGRLDVFTRLITDGATEFDRVRAGYRGPLFAEISPRTFSVLARAGDRLSQLRLRRGPPTEGAREVTLSVDLKGTGAKALLGYRAKRHAALVDFARTGYDPAEYWEPLYARTGRRSLILDPDDFYILSSVERVAVPAGEAAELVPFDPLVGEFRVHYAGFFDPGFGVSGVGGKGTKAVLEVRSHDVPFVLGHGQVVGRLVYEPMAETPEKLYGTAIGSSYGRQGLALSKHFASG